MRALRREVKCLKPGRKKTRPQNADRAPSGGSVREAYFSAPLPLAVPVPWLPLDALLLLLPMLPLSPAFDLAFVPLVSEPPLPLLSFAAPPNVVPVSANETEPMQVSARRQAHERLSDWTS